MKPKLGVVFPQITDREISELTVEKISISKSSSSMKLILGQGTEQEKVDRAAEAVKKA
ncbi:MAG: hypothetical protein LIO59_05195 [Oscillospiraceae bacterium]|nr:hypothetical protein [Oscillospiraceae bacterium]